MNKRNAILTICMCAVTSLLIVVRWLQPSQTTPIIDLKIGPGMGPDLMNSRFNGAREWNLDDLQQLVDAINSEMASISPSTYSLRIVTALTADGECITQTFEKDGDGDWILKKETEVTKAVDDANPFPDTIELEKP